MRKKCSCKICGLALCKSCASHELLIYIPDDSNKNIQEPEIVIIKVIGVGNNKTDSLTTFENYNSDSLIKKYTCKS